MVHIKLEDIIWLSGLLEGEGCFSYACSPTITLGMTDKDIVNRVAILFGKKTRGPYKYSHNKKEVYYTSVCGSMAVSWMMILYALMGERRKQKMSEIINDWKTSSGKGHKLGTGERSNCHPNRRHYARKMCGPCYKKFLRARKK